MDLLYSLNIDPASQSMQIRPCYLDDSSSGDVAPDQRAMA